jgi:hypothetical protein
VPEGFSDAFPRDIDPSGRVLGTAQLRPGPGGAATASRAVIWKRQCSGWRVQLLRSPEGAVVNAEHMNRFGTVVGTVANPAPGSTGGLLWRLKPLHH